MVVDSGEYFVLETLIPGFYWWLREKGGGGGGERERERECVCKISSSQYHSKLIKHAN